MSIKNLFKLLAIQMILVGCQTTENSKTVGKKVPNSKYVHVIMCSDLFYFHDTIQKNKYSKETLKQDAKRAFDACEETVDIYVDDVMKQVKRENGWTSLDPSVRPNFKKKFEKNMISELEFYFEKYYGYLK